MPNAIPREQDSEAFLDLLAASSHVNAVCKRVATLQATLAVVAAALGPLLPWIDPSLRVWSAMVGVTVLVFDAVILEPWHDRNRQLGALIQELFDTRLFHLPWDKLKCGPRPDQEALCEHARAYRRSHPTLKHLREWYPAQVGEMPLAYARLICQRSNLRWDMSLRRRYAYLLLTALVVLMLGGLAYAVWLKLSAEQIVLSVLVPVLPLVNRYGKECRDQFRVAEALDRQKSHLEEIWQRCLAGAEMTEEELRDESRRLQGVIYDRRARSPRVPDLLHRHMRDEHQVQMEEAAKNYARQAKATKRDK